MHIFFFVGEPGEAALQLKLQLETKGVTCIKISDAGEIQQAALQQGYAVNIFSDLEFAYAFLENNSFPGLRLLNIYYGMMVIQLSPQWKSRLDRVALRCFSPSTKSQLGVLMNDFIHNRIKSDAVADVEFTATSEPVVGTTKSTGSNARSGKGSA